jgi:O-acetyl-ADP-ribose deacetylase (regulator of RNase III)
MQIPLGGDRLIELVQGDITREATDAIVNAANSSLLGGGGVDGAIHRAGGPAILDACRGIRAERGPLPPGQAVATPGGRLAARYVIHTVGPIYQDGARGEPETLASCYRESIRLADELGLSSLAFPSISTGAFGYPVREAAVVAMAAVREALGGASSVRLARFVLFDRATLLAYQEAAAPAP